ncbi:hypothetical protein BKA65DRAFT_39412 [Rhexocercosporidium sp. MPI-PUGE-AT-0058]|nr:hypothetical protein BKA65DRAFT_39412 [Rhexocercosporidium sp. MPI-PUGE-AT-0058]
MDNINFEATIDKMLRMDMSEFAVEAKMTSVELSDWDCDSDEFLYTKLPMSQTYGKMLEWFVKKFWQAVKEEEEEERRVQKTIEEVEVKEVMALGTLILNKPFVPICFTCKQEGHVDRDCPKVDIVEESGLNDEGKYAYLASRGQGVDRGKSKFCTTCNKPGHVEEYCRWTHPEEEQEDSCSYCGRDGHMADACWKLHPELHRVYLQNRKPRVCQVCRKPDHLTKYCPDGKSYKYGLRPAP